MQPDTTALSPDWAALRPELDAAAQALELPLEAADPDRRGHLVIANYASRFAHADLTARYQYVGGTKVGDVLAEDLQN